MITDRPTLFAFWRLRDKRYAERRSGPPTESEIEAIRIYRGTEIAALTDAEHRRVAAEYLDRRWPA